MGGFKQHYISGVVVYTAFFIISMAISVIGWLLFELPRDWNPTIPMAILPALFCFTISFLCSLWPDVDIKSKSQQIFYTLFVTINLTLIFKGLYQISAFLGLFAMLPMLSKHRGWTHSRLTMIIFPTLFVIIPLYFESRVSNMIDFWQQLKNLDWPTEAKRGLPAHLAGVIGYATHLQVDGILYRLPKNRA